VVRALEGWALGGHEGGHPLGMVGMSRERTAGRGTLLVCLAGTRDCGVTSDNECYVRYSQAGERNDGMPS